MFRYFWNIFPSLLLSLSLLQWQATAQPNHINCYYAPPTVLIFPNQEKNHKISTTRFINEKVHRINYTNDTIQIPPSTTKPIITAGRGESEPIQLVIETSNQPLKNIKIKCTALSNNSYKLSAKNIDIRVVGYTRFKGKLWPDPLFPQHSEGIDIPKNTRQAWWITANIPKNQPEGIYKGKIEILSNNKHLFSLPFSVKVINFSFPSPLPMGVSIGLSIDKLVLPLALKRHFFPHHCCAGTAKPIFKVDSTGNIILDFTDFDKKIEKLRKEYGMKYICLGYIMGDGAGAPYWKTSLYPQAIDNNNKKIKICIDPRKDDRCRARFKAVMQQYVKHLKQKGWLDDSFIYLWDEPYKAPLRKQANDFAKYFRSFAPQIPLMVTGYIENCDIVCSLVNHCSDQAIERCQKEGKHYWIYTCGNLQDPSLTIGKPALDSRIFGWVGFRYHAENFLYWGITVGYKNTKLTNTITFEKTPRNGDGVLFYPPTKIYTDPIPSIRSENLRDGVEDAIILKTASKTHKAVYIRVKKLIPDQHHYNTDPKKYIKIRNWIYTNVLR